jgi:hypothetical protein
VNAGRCRMNGQYSRRAVTGYIAPRVSCHNNRPCASLCDWDAHPQAAVDFHQASLCASGLSPRRFKFKLAVPNGSLRPGWGWRLSHRRQGVAGCQVGSLRLQSRREHGQRPHVGGAGHPQLTLKQLCCGILTVPVVGPWSCWRWHVADVTVSRWTRSASGSGGGGHPGGLLATWAIG